MKQLICHKLIANKQIIDIYIYVIIETSEENPCYFNEHAPIRRVAKKKEIQINMWWLLLRSEKLYATFYRLYYTKGNFMNVFLLMKISNKNKKVFW